MRCVLIAFVAATDPRGEFASFKAKYSKEYASSTEEEERFEIFKQTLQRVEDGNIRNGEHVFGVTFMADRRVEEKYPRGRKGHGDYRFVDTAPHHEPAISSSRVANIDWRKTKAVTAVKNQGQCGSCWAFSAAETVESVYILNNEDHLENFSPQQIASCVTECDGCGGGDTVTAFQYLQKEPLAQAGFWPYVQGLTPLGQCMDASCTEACSSHNLTELKSYKFYIGPYASVTGFEYATPACTDTCADQDLTKLASALVSSPVSICVNAGSWDDYTGGVMTQSGCGGYSADDLDHCVQLVGYNTSAPKPYWIVRNSWDTGFGETGYIYLEYSKNTCGLADEATIPTLAKTARPEHYADLLAQATGADRDQTVLI